MRRVIGFFIATAISMYAQVVGYGEALSLFKNKQYTQAYEKFQVLFEENLDNEHINYYLGRSAFELGLYEDAINAFERVLIKLPDNDRSKLEMARSYFRLGDLRKSRKYFKELKQKPLPENVVKNIDKYLEAIEKNTVRSKLQGALIAGVLYDSNLYNASDAQQFYIPLYQEINNGIFENSTIDDDDFAHQEVLALNHLYDIGELGGYFVKNSFIFLNKTLLEYSSKNVFYLSYAPQFSFIAKEYKFDIGAMYDRIWYGSEKLLHTISAFAKGEYIKDSKLTLEASLKIQRKYNLVTTSKNKDAINYSMSVGAKYKITPQMQLVSTAGLQMERKVDGVLTNVDYDVLIFGVGIERVIDDAHKVSANIRYKNSAYQDIDAQYLKKREDDVWNFAISLNKKLPRGFLMQGAIGYNINSSNIISNDYDKYTINVNFIKPF
jgi:tetratricopeptide (TPR) repeat protein